MRKYYDNYERGYEDGKRNYLRESKGNYKNSQLYKELETVCNMFQVFAYDTDNEEFSIELMSDFGLSMKMFVLNNKITSFEIDDEGDIDFNFNEFVMISVRKNTITKLLNISRKLKNLANQIKDLISEVQIILNIIKKYM